MATITIKRRGETQTYESRKVYASVYSAGLNAHYGEKKSEQIAEEIEKRVTNWVKKHPHIKSSNIRDCIIEELSKIGEDDVALLYKHHLDVN